MLLPSEKSSKQRAEHLHRYFAHASSGKLRILLNNQLYLIRHRFLEELKSIENSCTVCLKIFNDIVAMDLKMLEDKSWILHAIDTLTRYSGIISVKSKRGKGDC